MMILERVFHSSLLLASCLALTGVAPPSASAQQMDPKAVKYFHKALNEHDLDKTISHLEKAVALQPNFQMAIYKLGISYFRKEDYGRCVATLRTFSDTNAPHYQEVRAYLKKALVNYVGDLVAENKGEEALHAAEDALEIAPRYPPALFALGLAQFQLRDWAASKKALVQSLELDPSQEKAWNRLGDVNMRLEDYTAAEKAYRQTLKINSEHKKARFHLNIAIKRNRPEVWLQKYEESLQNGDLKDTISILKRGLAAHPDHPELAAKLKLIENEQDYEFARTAIDQGDLALAKALLEPLDPDFKDTASLLHSVKARIQLDSLKQDAERIALSALSDLHKPGKTRERKSFQAKPLKTPALVQSAPTVGNHATPDTLASGKIKQQASNVVSFDTLDRQTIGGIKAYEPSTSDLVASKSGMPSADSTVTHVEEQMKLRRLLPDDLQKGDSILLFWIIVAGMAVIGTSILLMRRRRSEEVLPNTGMLRSVLQAEQQQREPAVAGAVYEPEVSHETFYDKIASETPVTFSPPLEATHVASDDSHDSNGGEEDAPSTHDETRTIIGGIKKAHRIGRYVIEKEIGRGSMGLVFKAWDPKLDRTVVIKQMKLPDSGSSRGIRLKDRLYREARAAGKLNHPNIVIIYDIEEENRCSYIVMEHLEGINLREMLDNEGALSESRSIEIVADVCSALSFAHDNDIIHRDIKPSNIMISGQKVKVADFGIAKLPHFGTLTRTGDVVGTPFYMSPEQIEGRKIDCRSDIFSLGVLLYEMLTGVRPFAGENIPSIVYKIVHQSPKLPSKLKDSLSASMDEILLKAMAKDADARYSSVAEFSSAICSIKVKSS